jgi:hypothetical protein
MGRVSDRSDGRATTARWDELYRALHEGVPTAEAADILSAIIRRGRHELISSLETDRAFVLGSFTAFRDLVANEAGPQTGWITEFLLPICTLETRTLGSNGRLTVYLLREFLGESLSRLPQPERALSRDDVIAALSRVLRSSAPEGACWTVSEIGYRDPDVVEALWSIAYSSTKTTADAALFGLSTLDVKGHHRDRLLRTLHRRAARRFSVPLSGAIRLLADPRSIGVVERHWLSRRDGKDMDHPGHLALRILAEIADRNPQDRRLQHRMWSIIFRSCRDASSELAVDLYLGGDVASRCNDECVVFDLLGLVSRHGSDRPAARRRRDMLYDRLQECTRPLHVKGFQAFSSVCPPAKRRRVLKCVRSDATRDTGSPVGPTERSIMKTSAWEILLSLGDLSLLSQYELAVAGESNHYLGKELSELLSCFQLRPPPESVLRFVQEPYAHRRDSTSSEWWVRDAATAIAESSATWESFEALLRFGFTYDGVVLLDNVLALTSVAHSLDEASDTRIVPALLRGATGPIERHRTAALGALRRLATPDARFRELEMPMRDLLSSDHVSEFDKSQAVRVLAVVYPSPPDDELLNKVVQLARAGSISDPLTWESLVALAHWHVLKHYPDLLSSHVGLEFADRFWVLYKDLRSSERRTVILCMLYEQEPDEFLTPFLSLLRLCDWRNSYVIFRTMEGMVSSRIGWSPGKDIRVLLKSRLSEPAEFSSPQVEIVEFLGHTSPDDLCDPALIDLWSTKPAEVLVALADSLKSTEAEINIDRASRLLVHLVSRSSYAVRRSAYRAMDHLAPAVLFTLSRQYAASPEPDFRLRAAEGLSWLSLEGDAHELFEYLAHDREKVVRERVQAVGVERRDREWARAYESSILSPCGYDNETIARLWAAGRALAVVGDDETLDKLRKRLQEVELPAHARRWLSRILKQLEARWREKVKKWPS